MRIPTLFVAALLVGCGPSAAELEAESAAAQMRKDCGRTYSSSQKVLQDMLYSKGVAEVTFVDRTKYIDKCVELKLGKAELKCVDPNLAEGEECKGLPDAAKKNVKALQAYMISPMTGKGGDAKEEKKKDPAPVAKDGEAGGEAGGEAAGGEAPAAGTEAPK